ncbi:MAG: crossover junction endodeoxyribonuclease RuvC, partial [Bacteriovoracaceae bacterium]
LMRELKPEVIALESLIYVKSPQALIKLAQARGVILAACVESHQGKIFEYSPNLVKSSAVGHGHADKESVRKFLDMALGKRNYKTHDESDAVAVAFCHIMNSGSGSGAKRSGSRGLASSLSHKV